MEDTNKLNRGGRSRKKAPRRRRGPDNTTFGPKVGRVSGSNKPGKIRKMIPGKGGVLSPIKPKRPTRKPAPMPMIPTIPVRGGGKAKLIESIPGRPKRKPAPMPMKPTTPVRGGGNAKLIEGIPGRPKRKPVTKNPNVDPRPPRNRRKTVTKRPNVDPRPLPIRKADSGSGGGPAIPVGMQRRIAANQRRVRGTSTNPRNLPASMQRRLAAQRRAVNQRKRSNANPTQRPSSRGNAPRPRSLRRVVGRNLSRLRGRR